MMQFTFRYRVSFFVTVFFVAVCAVALAVNSRYPVRALCGEESAGTWLSGAMLIMAAVLSAVAARRRGLNPWFLCALFFAVCAADERFMFHEQLKELLQFRIAPGHPPESIFYELAVIAGALAGGGVALLLWRAAGKSGRVLLAGAVAAGTGSVVIDVLKLGVVWEDGLKLAAELLALLMVTGEVEAQHEPWRNC